MAFAANEAADDGSALVCVAEVAAVRAEPRGDAEQVTQLLEGEPVTAVRMRGTWTEIRTA